MDIIRVGQILEILLKGELTCFVDGVHVGYEGNRS